jgi:hypothetical protein
MHGKNFCNQDPLLLVLADPDIIDITITGSKQLVVFSYTLGDRLLCKIMITEYISNANKIREIEVDEIEFINPNLMYINIVESVFAYYDCEVLIITFDKGYANIRGGKIDEFWRHMLEIYLVYEISDYGVIATKLLLMREKQTFTQFDHNCSLILAPLKQNAYYWNHSYNLGENCPIYGRYIRKELHYADILSSNNSKIGDLLMWKRKFGFITTSNDKIKIVFDQPIVLCTTYSKQDKFMKFIINHKDYMSKTGEITNFLNSQKFITLSRRDSICGGSNEFYIEIIYGFTYDVYNENKKDIYPYLNLNPMLERIYKDFGPK